LNIDHQQDWFEIKVTADENLIDVISNFFHEHGSNGTVIDDSAEQPAVVAYFNQEARDLIETELRVFLEGLARNFPDLPVPVSSIVPLKYENWAVLWKDNFKPTEIGSSLLVAPPREKVAGTTRHVVIIEPAQAFGTGTHETTQGCLELLEIAVGKIRDAGRAFSMLDVGTGSGILALAAFRLGATGIVAIDNDPIAVEAAKKNAFLNEITEVEFSLQSLDDISGRFEIVTANLDTRTLISVRDELIRRAGRYLIISGVTLTEWERLKKEFQLDLELISERRRNEWGTGLYQKKA
jgi:ribosomal protein L11 methyltransferase